MMTNLFPLWNDWLAASLHASLLIACILLLRLALRRFLPAQCFHLLWVLVAIRLLIPIAPHSSWSVFNLLSRQPAVEHAPHIRVFADDSPSQVRPSSDQPLQQPIAAAKTPPAISAAKPVDYGEILSVAWIIGIAVQLVQLAAASWKMRRKLGAAKRVEDARFLDLSTRSASLAGVSHPLPVFETGAVTAPAVTGLWRPRLLLPPGLAGHLSDDDLGFILVHEYTHVRRRDLAMLWLHFYARVIHWWNPLVWLAVRIARVDTELACDESVLHRLGPAAPDAYGHSLLKLARIIPWQTLPIPAASVVQGARTIRTRLVRIAGYGYSPLGPLRPAIAVLLLGAVAITFGADEKPPTVSPAQPDPGAVLKPERVGNTTLPAPTLSQQNPPDWVKGWSVTRLVIPSDGELRDAYVDFQTSTGRHVTLTQGVTSKEGVMIEGISWTGTPVRAKIILCRDSEVTNLFADASQISQSETLHGVSPNVFVQSKFFNMSLGTMKSMGISDAALTRNPKPKLPALAMVIDSAGLKQLLGKLQHSDAVHALYEPNVSTRLGQRAVIEMGDQLAYPNTWALSKNTPGTWTVPNFNECMATSLSIEPKVFEDDQTLQLDLNPKFVEVTGFTDFRTKKPLAPADAAQKRALLEKGLRTGANPFPDSTEPYMPVLTTSEVQTSINLVSGYSVVLALFDKADHSPTSNPSKIVDIIIVSAQIMSPDDKRGPLGEEDVAKSADSR